MGFWWDLTIIIVGGFMGYWLSRIWGYDMTWLRNAAWRFNERVGLSPPMPSWFIEDPAAHNSWDTYQSWLGRVWHTSPRQRQFLTKHLSQPHEFQELEIFKYQMIPNGIWCLDILSTTPIHSYPSLHRNHLNQMDLRLPLLGCKLSWRHQSRASRVSLLENQGTIRPSAVHFHPFEWDHRTKWGDDPAVSGSQWVIRRVVRTTVLVSCPVVGHVALQPTVRTP